MTEEELRALARAHGFYLQKMESAEKMLPCTCGCKKRRRGYSRFGVVAMCVKCGKKSDVGKSEADVRHKWNEMIRKEMSELDDGK